MDNPYQPPREGGESRWRWWMPLLFVALALLLVIVLTHAYIAPQYR